MYIYCFDFVVVIDALKLSGGWKFWKFGEWERECMQDGTSNKNKTMISLPKYSIATDPESSQSRRSHSRLFISGGRRVPVHAHLTALAHFITSQIGPHTVLHVYIRLPSCVAMNMERKYPIYYSLWLYISHLARKNAAKAFTFVSFRTHAIGSLIVIIPFTKYTRPIINSRLDLKQIIRLTWNL